MRQELIDYLVERGYNRADAEGLCTPMINDMVSYDKALAKCNLILKKMREFGYTDVVDTADHWTPDEMDYFLVNYEKHYLR